MLGTTPAAANWTSRDGSGEKPDYFLHESLNRSMHFALKGEGAGTFVPKVIGKQLTQRLTPRTKEFAGKASVKLLRSWILLLL